MSAAPASSTKRKRVLPQKEHPFFAAFLETKGEATTMELAPSKGKHNNPRINRYEERKVM
ncbi:hypothetical protein I656_03869 [Geobacillus sp. WSUCF1]|nr:hypothetical protein I656_03869 [Geobacillus sp. WSUCF1]